jgi:hypothetical protein
MWRGCMVVGSVSLDEESRTAVVAVTLTDEAATRVVPLSRRAHLDDHLSPAVLPLDDHRLLVGWTGHDDEHDVHLVIVSPDGEGFEVASLGVLHLGAPATYVNLLLGPEDDTIRVITRLQKVGQVIVEVDRRTGAERRRALVLWHHPRAEDPWRSGRGGKRPYVVYRQKGSLVWFAANEDHPRSYRSGVWCGVLDGDIVRDADGTEVRRLVWVPAGGAVDIPPDLNAFDGLSCVVPPGGAWVPWVHDLAVAQDGSPVIAFSEAPKTEEVFATRHDIRTTALRYRRAVRLTPGHWVVDTIALAGSSLGAREADYAGGISVDPRDPAVMAFSADVWPDGRPMETRRLFVVDTTGQRPQFQVVDEESRGAAMRPTFTSDAGSQEIGNGGPHALAYFQGRYDHYSDYDVEVSARVFRAGSSCWHGHDAHADLYFPLDADTGLPPRVRAEVVSRLETSHVFLEYGAGSTTLLAMQSSPTIVISIESNRTLQRALAIALASDGAEPGRYRPVDTDWSCIGEWGHPRDDAAPDALGRAYVSLADHLPAPDLVLIDGRFRTACFLKTLRRAPHPTVILWDDYRQRSHYHWVERYVRPVAMAGRMAVFEIGGAIDVEEADFTAALGDVR